MKRSAPEAAPSLAPPEKSSAARARVPRPHRALGIGCAQDATPARGEEGEAAARSARDPPRSAQKAHRNMNASLRDENMPIFRRFADMGLPAPLLEQLHARDIYRPTAYQSLALSSILSDRHTILSGFPRCGKRTMLSLAVLSQCLDAERRHPLEENDGPFVLLVCMSREEAKSYSDDYADVAAAHGLKAALCIGGGGDSGDDSSHAILSGCHLVISTLRKAEHLIKSSVLLTDHLRALYLLSLDRVLFHDVSSEFNSILPALDRATRVIGLVNVVTADVESFTSKYLSQPQVIDINPSLIGLNVLHELEPCDDKKAFLLSCLVRTRPPVLIFLNVFTDSAELSFLSNYDLPFAVLDSTKSLAECEKILSDMRAGAYQVVVVGDVDARSLSFPNVSHVINYDFPDQIEQYIFRAGRCGRKETMGLCTSLLSTKERASPCVKQVVHMLRVIRHPIPPFLDD